MKKLILSIISILLISAFVFGQKNKQTPQVVEDTDPSSQKSSGNDEMLLRSGTNLDAQLQGTLDVKKSKVGDEVVLKTTKHIKENGEVVVAKGTKLIGRITEVQERTKENGVSKIGMVIDKIEGKNLSAPINASIVSITNLNNKATVGDVFASDTSASSTSSGNVSRGNSGGGLLGGSGGLVGGVTNTVGGTLNTTTNTVGGLTNTAGQTVGGVTNTVGTTVNGLQISQSANGSANSSTTLSSQDKNLRIEKGASFQIQLNSSVEN